MQRRAKVVEQNNHIFWRVQEQLDHCIVILTDKLTEYGPKYFNNKKHFEQPKN
jgi:hypothetical protein